MKQMFGKLKTIMGKEENLNLFFFFLFWLKNKFNGLKMNEIIISLRDRVFSSESNDDWRILEDRI